MSESTRTPMYTPADIPQAIPDALAPIPRTVRQGVAGLLTMGPGVLELGGAIANPARFVRELRGLATPEDAQPDLANTLTGAGRAGTAMVNRALGVDDPSVLDNPVEAAARFVGGSLPAAPLAIPRALLAVPPAVRVAAAVPIKAVELLSPLSLTTSRTVGGRAANVAANVAAQGVVGGAVEYNVEGRDPTLPYNVLDDDGNVSSIILPEKEAGAGRHVARAIGTAVGDHPVAAAAGGLAALAGGLYGVRAARQAAASRSLLAQSDVIAPRDRVSTDVPIIESATPPPPATSSITGWVGAQLNRGITAIDNSLHVAAEVTQDAGIRTKEALRQSAATPEDFLAARDSMDIVNPQAHADRLISALEQGIIATPMGEKRTINFRRWSEDLAIAGRDDPDMVKNTKELIALETEADNRAYARLKQADLVSIDRRTGERAGPSTPPSEVQQVTPRATLYHLDDTTLANRISDIRRQSPDAVRRADDYWKYHADFADALVDFGVLSKQERKAWGKANPHFMHTINLDDPKSPRTYRLREHGTVKEAGDPILATAEYTDYMLSHVYNNRMRQTVVETLRGANSTPFANGKWLGKVADPQQMRRTVVPTGPGSLNTRAMTADDIPLKGNVVSYYKDGEMVRAEVLNPQIHNTMTRRPSQALAVLGWTRQLAQSGMTGKISTITGQPFFLANTIMGMSFGAISRPAGMAFGYLDAGMQRLTGGKVGVRMDPTAAVGGVYSAGADVAAIMTKAFSEALHNSLSASGTLSRIIGGQRTQAIADAAARAYTESMYAKRSRIGANSASSFGETDWDASGGKSSIVSTITPHGNTARIVGDAKGILETATQWKATVVPADVRIAARMMGDIQEAIGNMAQSLLFRQNYGKVDTANAAAVPLEARSVAIYSQVEPLLTQALALRAQARASMPFRQGSTTVRQRVPQTHPDLIAAKALEVQAQPFLTQLDQLRPQIEKARAEWFREYNKLGVATRQLLGDPGQMGTGLRDMGKGGTAYEQVAGFMLTITPYANIGFQASARLIRAAKENPMGTAAAVAMGLLPAGMAPFANAVRLDEELEAAGQEPMYVKYDLSRPSWDVTRSIPFYMRGIPPDEAPRMRLDPLLSPFVTLFREMLVRVDNFAGDVTRDPILGESRAAIQHIAGERMWDRLRTGALNALPMNQVPPIVGAGAAALGFQIPEYAKMFSRGATPLNQAGLGGFEQTRLSGGIVSRTWEAIIGSLAGSAGMTMVSALNQGAISEKATPGTFVSGALNELGGKARARLPEVQPLWGQPIQRAATTFFADAVNAKETAVQRFSQGIANVNTPGTVGRGDIAERAEVGRQGVADPEVRRVLNATVEFSRAMQPLVTARQKQRDRLLEVDQRLTNRDYVSRLNDRNTIARDIDRINAELLSKYTAFEERLSQRTGYVIRVESIDPTKPITQFPRAGQ